MDGKTCKHWLLDAAKKLKFAKVEHPHLVAEVILSWSLKQERASMIAHSDELIGDDELEKADALLNQRVSGVPLSYVLEETEFFSLKIKVTPAVLVPEAETEHLVQAVLDIAASNEFADKENIRIIDVGTGSGCILAAIAVNDARFTGYGVDICADTLEIAEFNLKQHGVLERFCLLQSDIFAAVPGEKNQKGVQKFDFIVSNPPYIALTERESLLEEVLTQPEVSLFGGTKGTEFTQRFIEQSVTRINPGGYLIIEIGQDTQDEIVKFAENLGFLHKKTIPDYTKIERILVFQVPLSSK